MPSHDSRMPQLNFTTFTQIHQHKYEFNQRLLNLRDKKIGIIEEIKEIIAQLNYVQSLLGPEHSLPLPEVPRMGMDELPEKLVELLQFGLYKV